jgi:hypothetical protein
MKTRRIPGVTTIHRLRAVYQRGDEREGESKESRSWDQPAAQVEINSRCPVCRTVCPDGAGTECPVATLQPGEHARVAELLRRAQAEKSRPHAELLRGQAETVRIRLLQTQDKR